MSLPAPIPLAPDRAPVGPLDLARLTGLRAVAAWWVVWFHFGRELVAPGDAGWAWVPARLAAAGHVSVDLFFTLSGFVLAHRYAPSDVAAGGRRAFFVRRVARVYPLYLVSLALGFAAEWPRSARDLGAGAGQLRLALQLALLNAWSHKAMFRLNWAAWSLSAEALMYLLFPWLLLAVARLSRRGLLAVLAGCWAAVFVAPALYGALDPDHLGRPLALGDEVLWSWYLKFFPLQRLPEFVAGVAAACLVRASPPSERASRQGPRVLALVLAAVLLSGRVPYAYLHSGVLLPLFVGAIAWLGTGAQGHAGLAWPPLVALGRASYATYILHVPLFLVAARARPGLWDSANDRAGVAVYAAGLLVVSLAAHRWVEEPLRRAVERWGGARGRARGGAVLRSLGAR